MGLNCGIVGLPNVGKSTIFNAMTSQGALVANYPFATINPNLGIVPLRDERLYKLSELVKPEKIIPTVVEFVDIAGLVKGASKGEGLGNQFLAHIREVQMIAHIVRCFTASDIARAGGGAAPRSDIEIVDTELMLVDIAAVEKRFDKTEKLAKTGDKEAKEVIGNYKIIKEHLEKGFPVRTLPDEVKDVAKDLTLLSAKPVLYVANTGEEDLMGLSEAVKEVEEFAKGEGADFIIISGKVEAEIAELKESEREEFLKGLGLKESGLERLSKKAYGILGLITFFTAGKKEVRAWTIKKGAKAPEAAGAIHSDFEKGFIKAEVISYEDFIKYGSESACRDKGVIRIEGKDYVVKDGDIMHFRFAV